MKDDPDNRATDYAAAVLKRAMGERKHAMTQTEAWQIAFITVNAWVQNRTHNWAVRRGRACIGDPDAMTLGFAEAALTVIADKASGLPFDKPIGQWSKVDAARLFALAHDAIEETRIQTLEDPTLTELPA
jgi:hypothetical protein